MAHNLIINIGRQYGSGGKAVAVELGRKLGISVYDSELLSKAAEESGFSRDLFTKKDERRNLFTLSGIFGSVNRNFSTDTPLSDNGIFKIQSEVIRKIAMEGPAIFVGRAADYVLRDMECLDVFICAPIGHRVERICQRLGVDEEEAEKRIEKQDRVRASYYNYFTFSDWGVASNYDLCVDASILGIEGTADYIIEFARRRGMIE